MAGGNRTQLVVIGRQSFDASVLPRLARELGCDEYWFRMGNTTFSGLETNLISFSPDAAFQRVQGAIRAALAVGARIRFIGCGEDMPHNTVWMAHTDSERDGLSAQDWAALQGAGSQDQFNSLFREKGIRVVPLPGHPHRGSQAPSQPCPS